MLSKREKSGKFSINVRARNWAEGRFLHALGPVSRRSSLARKAHKTASYAGKAGTERVNRNFAANISAGIMSKR